MDTPTRRAVLALAIQDMPLPIRTEHLAAESAAAGFSGHRNTARKDARSFVGAGLLAPLPGTGNRTYTRTEAPPLGDCPNCECCDEWCGDPIRGECPIDPIGDSTCPCTPTEAP